jgi:hypothetical protein
MRFKLDENLGSRTAPIFSEFGHEVETISEEKLNGASDSIVFAAYVSEERCLVTLDLDFADVIRFPPGSAPGIAVSSSAAACISGYAGGAGAKPADYAREGTQTARRVALAEPRRRPTLGRAAGGTLPSVEIVRLGGSAGA